MFERIIEIIVYVMTELQNKEQLTEIDFEKLHKLGYTNSEISTAFSWLVDRMELSETIIERQEKGIPAFRVLHEAEEELFTKEAYGELIHMQSLGLLSNEQLETLIEKTLMSGAIRINKKDLRKYLASILINQSGDTFYGSRVMLNGNDTIN